MLFSTLALLFPAVSRDAVSTLSSSVDSLPVHEAFSGIFGSISLTSWLCLLVPQLLENYRNQSAEAISLPFIVIWFVGDLCNLFGGLWAGLVPVVIAIAAYFCISDAVLLTQVLYYGIRNRRREGRTLLRATTETFVEDGARRDSIAVDGSVTGTHDTMAHAAGETEPLLRKNSRTGSFSLPGSQSTVLSTSSQRRRRRSSTASGKSAPHLGRRPSSAGQADEHLSRILEESSSDTGVRDWVRIAIAVFAVCAIGTAGWALAYESGAWRPSPPEPVGNGGGSGAGEHDDGAEIARGAQVLGYASAVLYLCARIPQIIKNWREKSCEGLALLFFILSLMGNLTYGAGILFHSTDRTYVLKNTPWLIGSLGTMLEDVIIFIQFRLYRNPESDSGVLGKAGGNDGEVGVIGRGDRDGSIAVVSG